MIPPLPSADTRLAAVTAVSSAFEVQLARRPGLGDFYRRLVLEQGTLAPAFSRSALTGLVAAECAASGIMLGLRRARHSALCSKASRP